MGVHPVGRRVSGHGALDLSRTGAGRRDLRVTFRGADYLDPGAIVPRLRPRDADALARLGDPVRIVEDGLANSVAAWAVDVDGEIAVLWGVRVLNLLDDKGYLWMLGTTAIERHRVAFLRHSRAAIEELRGRYGLLYGEIESDFAASVRWLTWCGARVRKRPHPEGHLVFTIEGASWRLAG